MAKFATTFALLRTIRDANLLWQFPQAALNEGRSFIPRTPCSLRPQCYVTIAPDVRASQRASEIKYWPSRRALIPAALHEHLSIVPSGQSVADRDSEGVRYLDAVMRFLPSRRAHASEASPASINPEAVNGSMFDLSRSNTSAR